MACVGQCLQGCAMNGLLKPTCKGVWACGTSRSQRRAQCASIPLRRTARRQAERGPSRYGQAKLPLNRQLVSSEHGLKTRASANASLDVHPWHRTTQQLVSLATPVFLALLLPQIHKNWRGDPVSLSILSWAGYSSAFVGNALLLSYFLDRNEGGAALIQSIGATSNAVVISQIFAAGFLSRSVFTALASVAAVATVTSLLKANGALRNGRGRAVWSGYRDLLGIIGVATVVQVLSTMASNIQSLAPAAAALPLAVVVYVAHRTSRLPARLESFWTLVPGWTATVLFAIQPIAQLAQMRTSSSSWGGLSAASISLAMAGNGLMLPRALLTRDAIWTCGSAWGIVAGWTQLLCMALNRSEAGQRYLGLELFTLASVATLVALATTITNDARARQLSSV